VLHRCAKRDRDRRFHALYDKVARGDVLWRAWGEVRANRGAPGVDGITIDDVVPFGVGEFLDRLAEQLRPGTYRPRPLRRTYIPEPGKPGQLRPLGIPCLADRVVMAAAIVLEPIFEADFLPASYGFRLRLSAHHALETVRQTATWRGKQWRSMPTVASAYGVDRIRHDLASRRFGVTRTLQPARALSDEWRCGPGRAQANWTSTGWRAARQRGAAGRSWNSCLASSSVGVLFMERADSNLCSRAGPRCRP
jgi:hypothetical protein